MLSLQPELVIWVQGGSIPKHDISKSQKYGVHRKKEKKLGGWMEGAEQARIGAREGEKGTDAEAWLSL